ncbi:hypothetical protein L7F22_051772 [Adiantum nelumboides]|nr:hypothetical protein [Adiantum nelumboides]
MAACLVICVILVMLTSGGLAQAVSMGLVHNLSVSRDTVFELFPNVSLQAYGGLMEPKLALRSEVLSNSTSQAWLCFIPSGPSSYILSIYLFYTVNGLSYNDGVILWMANRNNPVSGNFSLTLDTTGNLVLRDGNGSIAWSSGTSGRGVVAMELSVGLNDYSTWGALLLSSANGSTLWSSFDSPTDILMTGQSLQQGMPLVSWNYLSDPAEGPYSLVLEAGGLALYYNALGELPQPYWIWGFYGRNDTFGVTHTCNQTILADVTSDGGLELEESHDLAPSNSWWPEFCSANISNFQDLEFKVYGTRLLSDITFLRMNPDGNLFAYTLTSAWALVFDLFNENLCLLPDYCGPYGVCTSPSNACSCPNSSDGSFPSVHPSVLSLGCPPTYNLTCALNNSSKNQKFLELNGVDYFSNRYSSPLNLSTQESCKDACLQNCSCLAAFWHGHSNSCFHAEHHMGSLQGSLDSTHLAFLKVEDVSQPTKSSSAAKIIGGVVSSVAALLLIFCFLGVYKYRKWSADPELEDEDPFLDSAPGLPIRYSYKDLELITKEFSDELGKGGFGKVYAGVLQDGTNVAVKRLESLRQGRKEFRAEVMIMGGIHHYNLVGLIGFCSQGSHRLLVYEYMANRSLDHWLFTAKIPLGWPLRFSIALGAARGLAYLHEECKNTVIHLDIKPQNILLDDNFVAKVSDFGLSRLMLREETHVVTTMRGTPGYLAPEWLTEGAISEKCDVFSFGMLLMEILGARKNLNPSLTETEKVYFPAWVYHQIIREGKVADLTSIASVETPEEVMQARLMMNTAFLCVLDSPSLRPSMVTVVHMLEGLVPILDLQLSDLFQNLHFALRMEDTSAQTSIEEILASLYGSVSSGTSKLGSGGVMSFEISTR